VRVRVTTDHTFSANAAHLPPPYNDWCMLAIDAELTELVWFHEPVIYGQGRVHNSSTNVLAARNIYRIRVERLGSSIVSF